MSGGEGVLGVAYRRIIIYHGVLVQKSYVIF